MGETNKWIVVQDDDKSVERTEFVGDQNALITKMLAQMKEDKAIGEKMLKKRMATKKEENEREAGKDDVPVTNYINTSIQNPTDMDMYR